MAKRQGKSSKAATGKSSKKKSPHPGGSEEEAKAVGGKLDFGIQRAIAPSVLTPRSIPNALTRAARLCGPGPRDPASAAWAGMNPAPVHPAAATSTPISSALAPEAESPPAAKSTAPGPDDATGTSRDFASAAARGENEDTAEHPIKGSTVQYGDETTAPEGADAASHAEGDDDAFAGEVSSDEASGRNDAGG